MIKLPAAATTLPAPVVKHAAPAPAAAAPLAGNAHVAAQALCHVWSGEPATIVASPPGAGKTTLVSDVSASLARRAHLRVAVSANTNLQAIDLANRIAANGAHTILVLATKANRPRGLHERVVTITRKGDLTQHRHRPGVTIATSARWQWLDERFDVLVCDEAWQLTFADLGSLGILAPQVFMVGDPGQIAPVVTADVSRWAFSPVGPQQPAPTALLATYDNDDHFVSLRLPHTYRLGPTSATIVSAACYPDMPFVSAPDRPARNLLTGAQMAPEMTTVSTTGRGGPLDPTFADTAANRVRDILDAGLLLDGGTERPVTGEDIAVVTPHVAQAAAVAARLADIAGVTIATINQAQGAERPVVVALEPMAGHHSPDDSFGLDVGRLTVALSRHMAHLTLVTDTATPAVLRAAIDDGNTDAATYLTALDAIRRHGGSE